MKEYSNDELINYLNTATLCLRQAKGITGFALSHNYREIYEKVRPYLDLRNQVITKYGELGEDGEYHIVDEDKLEIATKELDGYGQLKMAVDIIVVPEDKMGDSGLTAAQLLSLTWMTKPCSSDMFRTVIGISDDEDDAEETSSTYDPSKPIDDDRFM